MSGIRFSILKTLIQPKLVDRKTLSEPYFLEARVGVDGPRHFRPRLQRQQVPLARSRRGASNFLATCVPPEIGSPIVERLVELRRAFRGAIAPNIKLVSFKVDRSPGWFSLVQRSLSERLL